MSSEKKMGAPKKSNDKKRTSKVAVNVTSEQLENYHKAAEKSDQAYSEWVRETLNKRAKEIL